MINYFDEAEKMLASRGSLETALSNLERRRARIISNSAPASYPSVDTSKPYTSAKNANDTLTELLELAEIAREIQTTQDTLHEIDLVIEQLERDDERIIRLWYMERKSKEQIAAELSYASVTSIYDLLNKAVSRFALLYFGAGALASV
jgi:DNA-directed RNA polymerase specialized sigma24 family protein